MTPRPDQPALLETHVELEPLTATPDGALLWAVLERAVMDWGGRCLYGGTSWRQTGRYVTDAACWFAAGEDAGGAVGPNDRPWSFVWVCRLLDLDPDTTKDLCYRYIETTLHPHATRR